VWRKVGAWSARLAELFQQPRDEILESPAKPVFAGKKHSQPESQKCGEYKWRHEVWVSWV
jgi:hypothetical protein